MESLNSKRNSDRKISKASLRTISPRSPRKSEKDSQHGSPRQTIQTTGYIKEKDGAVEADEAATVVKSAKPRR